MNRSQATDVIILKTNPIGENHRGVTMLCRDRGLSRAIAYGANSSRGKLRGSAVSFCAGRAYLYTNPRTDSTKITDLDAEQFFVSIRGDLVKFYTASLWAELVLKSYASGGDSEDLFLLLRSSLEELDTRPQGSADLVSIQFLWRFLTLAGSKPDLENCACCGEYLDGDGGAVYIAREHGFCSISHGCTGQEAQTEDLRWTEEDPVRWSEGVLAYLRHTSGLGLAEALRVSPPPGTSQPVKRVIYSIIEDLVEVELNTLRTGAGII